MPVYKIMDLCKMEEAVSMLLDGMNVSDPEVLAETPRRVAKMYRQFVENDIDPLSILKKTFPVPSNDPVLVRDIFFTSLCEHHLLPFFGHVNIAYIPNGRVVGLSKLGQLVDCIATRLQLQERMTAQIGEAIYTGIPAQGCIVLSKAQHMCMICRKGRRFDSPTVSYFKKGDISETQVKMMLDM